MPFAGAMIFVKDLPRMAAFYEEALGLTLVADTRQETWVEFGDGFSLHAIPAEIAAGIHTPSPPRPRETDPVKLSFEVDDLAAAYARLERLGVTLLDRPWGDRDRVDPEGNVFDLRAAQG